MKGLSKKEIKLVAELEFEKKYYFTTEEAMRFFKNKRQLTNTLYSLRKKGRIISLNKSKHFLIPIMARKGAWAEHPIIVADEMLDGKNYFIGGWYAAYYWKLTEQIPAQVDIYTTRRQGKATVLNKRFVFHRTTQHMIDKSITREIDGHSFRIISKENVKKWMKSRK